MNPAQAGVGGIRSWRLPRIYVTLLISDHKSAIAQQKTEGGDRRTVGYRGRCHEIRSRSSQIDTRDLAVLCACKGIFAAVVYRERSYLSLDRHRELPTLLLECTSLGSFVFG